MRSGGGQHVYCETRVETVRAVADAGASSGRAGAARVRASLWTDPECHAMQSQRAEPPASSVLSAVSRGHAFRRTRGPATRRRARWSDGEKL